MERTFSFWGSALQVFGQCGGASARKQKVAGGWGEGHFLLARPNSTD